MKKNMTDEMEELADVDRSVTINEIITNGIIDGGVFYLGYLDGEKLVPAFNAIDSITGLELASMVPLHLKHVGEIWLITSDGDGRLYQVTDDIAGVLNVIGAVRYGVTDKGVLTILKKVSNDERHI